jgi:hypothetical protein
MGWAIVRAG